MPNDIGKSGVAPTESETTCTVGNLSHGSRETPATSASPMVADRSEKARCHNPDMHVAGESDSSIVPGTETGTGTFPRVVWAEQARCLHGVRVLSRQLAFPGDEHFFGSVSLDGSRTSIDEVRMSPSHPQEMYAAPYLR